MTHLTPHHWARAATAIVSMAVFSAVFFELAASGVVAVALLCLLTLSATVWVDRRTRRSITEAITAIEASPPPLVVTVDGAATMPRTRPVFLRVLPLGCLGCREPVLWRKRNRPHTRAQRPVRLGGPPDLSPAEAADMMARRRQRNLSACTEGRADCDHARLTAADARTVASVERRRNAAACASGYGYCYPSQLPSAKAGAGRARTSRRPESASPSNRRARKPSPWPPNLSQPSSGQ